MSVPRRVWLLEHPEATHRALRLAANDALVWFENWRQGTGRNGLHDDIQIARRLRAALDALDEEAQP